MTVHILTPNGKTRDIVRDATVTSDAPAGFVRVQGMTDERESLWWYTGLNGDGAAPPGWPRDRIERPKWWPRLFRWWFGDFTESLHYSRWTPHIYNASVDASRVEIIGEEHGRREAGEGGSDV